MIKSLLEESISLGEKKKKRKRKKSKSIGIVQSHLAIPFTYFHEIVRYIKGKSLQLSANCTTPLTIISLITFVVDNTPFPPGTTRIFLSFTTPRFSHHPPPLGVAANQARLS